MPRKDGSLTALDVIQETAVEHGHAEGNCKSCRHLMPTGEAQYAWCELQDRPQFQLGVCTNWSVRDGRFIQHPFLSL